MAKKNKKVKNEQEELELIDEELNEEDDDTESSPKKKKGGCLIKLIILIIIIAIPITLISLNVGNVRDKYLRPGLERIPIIKNLLPPLDADTEDGEKNEVVDEKQQIIDSLTKEIKDLNNEIARLKEFEKVQLEFKAQKEEFDKMIALNDPKAYSSFYESISPENAEELYKQAINKEVTDKRFKGYIQTFETMKKDAVATILEELITTDTDLVVTILENVSSDKRSEILSTMDPKNAASLSKLLAPIK